MSHPGIQEMNQRPVRSSYYIFRYERVLPDVSMDTTLKRPARSGREQTPLSRASGAQGIAPIVPHRRRVDACCAYARARETRGGVRAGFESHRRAHRDQRLLAAASRNLTVLIDATEAVASEDSTCRVLRRPKLVASGDREWAAGEDPRHTRQFNVFFFSSGLVGNATIGRALRLIRRKSGRLLANGRAKHRQHGKYSSAARRTRSASMGARCTSSAATRVRSARSRSSARGT